MGLFDKPEEPGRTNRLDVLEARVQHLETRLAHLTAQQHRQDPATPAVAGVSVDVLAQVQSLKRDGKIINAVKVYREATGLGLAEAKAAVDAL